MTENFHIKIRVRVHNDFQFPTMYDQVFYIVNIANENFKKIISDCFVMLFIRKQSLLYLYVCLSALQISQIQNVFNDILLCQ